MTPPRTRQRASREFVPCIEMSSIQSKGFWRSSRSRAAPRGGRRPAVHVTIKSRSFRSTSTGAHRRWSRSTSTAPRTRAQCGLAAACCPASVEQAGEVGADPRHGRARWKHQSRHAALLAVDGAEGAKTRYPRPRMQPALSETVFIVHHMTAQSAFS